MKKHQSKIVALLAALAATLCACSSAPLGVASNTYVGDESGLAEEYIGDRDLAAKFVLVGLKTEIRDGRRRVQFDLKNTTSADLRFEWMMAWQDDHGFKVNAKPHWKPMVVTGQGFESIQATAPTPDASTFRIVLRRPTPIR
jgi:uncharacterized protein YcfL